MKGDIFKLLPPLAKSLEHIFLLLSYFFRAESKKEWRQGTDEGWRTWCVLHVLS